MDKPTIRKKYHELRREISNEKREEYSEKISERVLDFLKINPSIRHIHIFLTISRLNEINTFPLVGKLQHMGYILYTSYINPGSGVLDTLEISGSREFKSDAFGIPVPEDFTVVENTKIQMVLIPLLAFDERGNRLGYGKAYYDQFLSSFNHQIIKVGLSFFPPIEEIPAESHDIGLDICITPEKMYHFGHL
ncbi:5-formyltetrahydrofolate cyclo-ligase [Aquiflexum sp. LQ15W]|uniref:5-formyltetrahydrofolate cyclo-ligase n=1 Tax=Cognataquiflexum nitidum TaxID=2922272 RepID=UPI001F12A25C|nr:5-formyltetrahydrofolate cyclo-ligase [Cognataquiflexum nitidum]MCH6198525.1 5-formyltetrahydrofolate cyclo-ligase [Cognataquiflexum nitidum]